MTMVPLSPVDAKQIHQQILQLENLHRDMIVHDSVNASTVASTLSSNREITSWRTIPARMSGGRASA